MDVHQFKIRNADIEIIQAIDIAKVEVDAVIVPQMQESISPGADGIAVALVRAGAGPGILSFQDRIAKTRHKSLPFGTAHITEAGGGVIPYIISVITVGETRERAFSTIHDSVVNGLTAAREHGKIKTIGIPALSTGSEGSLSSRQSAQAMMLGIYDYLSAGNEPLAASFVVQRPPMFQAFVEEANSKDYVNANPAQVGERDFNMELFLRNMRSRVAPEIAALLSRAVP